MSFTQKLTALDAKLAYIASKDGVAALLAIALLAIALLIPAPAWSEDTSESHCQANDLAVARGCSEQAVVRDAAPMAAHLDWEPMESVPHALRNRQCLNCEGRYIDPLSGESTDTPAEESSIHARANSTELRESEVVLTGGVSATQAYRRMRGDNVIVNRAEESITITGNVTLREPGVLLHGDRAEIHTQTGEANLQEAQFVFHQEHLHGSADRLVRDEKERIRVRNGTLSFCAPGEDQWRVRADHIKLDTREGLATVRDATIDVKDVPVFYTPWLRFPLDDRRRTGFLWPDFGNDSTGGLDVTVPVYFNLAPNYDALYSPRFIEERGLSHDMRLRYLHPSLGAWSVGGAYMNSDDRYENQVPDNRSTDRWLGQIKHYGLINQRWRSRVDYSKARDADYLKDLETSNLTSQRRTSLLQLASLDYLGDRWLLGLQAQQFQSLADDINDDYKKLPQFTARYLGSAVPFTWQPIFLGQYSNFDTEEERVTGQRLYAEAGVSYPMLWTFGYVTPTVKYRQLQYELSDLQVLNDDNPSAGSALANVDAGLIFERSTALSNRNFLQTLEPRVYYLFSERERQDDHPDFDSAELTFTYNQLFRETRFSGRDRLDDANQIAVGLTTRLIDERTGHNFLSASIGQIYYFRDRKVRLLSDAPALNDSGSEIAGELQFSPEKSVKLRTSLIYDPDTGNMNAGHVQSSYHSDGGAIFNLGYSYRRPGVSNTLQRATEEASVSTYLPLNSNWSVFAAMNYSLVANQSVEDMFGVEYESCCWTLRLLHLRYYNNVSSAPALDDPDLERENTTQFQIILKGMGGFGDRITDIMEDLIRGFEERDF